jgi:tRNA (guanine-N7-)-methyltransferase
VALRHRLLDRAARRQVRRGGWGTAKGRQVTDGDERGTGVAERRNFYGRIHGKTMRAAQKAALATDLDRLRLPGVTRDDNPGRAVIDVAALTGGRPLWLEIGFGGGEHLAAMAQRYPDVFILGCEVFVNGVAMALGQIARVAAGGVTNVAIHPGDVRDLFDILPPASIARAFLNYPDPWPKRRHNRRRFVTPDHLLPLARLMPPGALFRVATDIPDYVRQARAEIPKAGFALADEGAVAWTDWPGTRYEAKALREGRVPHYMTWMRGAG